MEQLYREARSHGTPVFPLQVYSHHDTNGFYMVSQHWHEEAEWVYVDQGTMELTVRGRSYALGPDSFCFVNAGELHEIRSSGESYHHAIVFRPILLDFALYDLCQHDLIGPVTKGRLLFPSAGEDFSPGEKEEILRHMRRIAELYHARPEGGTLGIKIELYTVLDLLFRSGRMRENRVTPKGLDSMRKLKEVVSYVERNFSSPISLDTLAEIACMSPNYFCHYFRREIGTSPIAFVNEYRIQQAARLLSETNMQISEIALAVGFDNFSYFIRKFRASKSMTPKMYRAVWMEQKTDAHGDEDAHAL